MLLFRFPPPGLEADEQAFNRNQGSQASRSRRSSTPLDSHIEVAFGEFDWELYGMARPSFRRRKVAGDSEEERAWILRSLASTSARTCAASSVWMRPARWLRG